MGLYFNIILRGVFWKSGSFSEYYILDCVENFIFGYFLGFGRMYIYVSGRVGIASEDLGRIVIIYYKSGD